MIFSQSRIPKHFALCRLLTTQEAWLLSKAGDPVLHWTALWTVPLAWAARLISHAFNITVIVPKDHFTRNFWRPVSASGPLETPHSISRTPGQASWLYYLFIWFA